MRKVLRRTPRPYEERADIRTCLQREQKCARGHQPFLACYAMLRAMLRYATLCYAMRCDAMLCYAKLCYAMLCYAMRCDAMRCYAMGVLLPESRLANENGSGWVTRGRCGGADAGRE